MAPQPVRPNAPRWWETRRSGAAAILLSTCPLLLPAFPPLVDVPGHIGRYHVAAAIAQSAALQQHWAFHWRLIGNLGVDLLVMPLQPLLGPVLAAKLVIMTIPALFVLGLILLSRACDGRQSPALWAAFPLAYSFPFQFGFVNFVLSAALAILALALWIRLGKQRRLWLRAVLFVPVSALLWTAHSFGWGMFGLFAFASEWQRLRCADRRHPIALVFACLACVPLMLPIVPMAVEARNSGGGLGIQYDWLAKIFWALTVLRERWFGYDIACTALLFTLPIVALRQARNFYFEPTLGLLAVVAFATFLALPRLLLGGAYVDARMVGIALALALAAIRCRDGSEENRLAIIAACFFVLRTTTTAFALFWFARGQAQALDVVAAIPRGATVLVVVNEPCRNFWRSDRLEHVDGIAIARRDIFDNGQWTIAGQQLIAARHPSAGTYRSDPSQLAYPTRCEPETTTLPNAIRQFDRSTFGYIWTMDFPSRPRLAPDVIRVWSNDVSTLYQVSDDHQTR